MKIDISKILGDEKIDAAGKAEKINALYEQELVNEKTSVENEYKKQINDLTAKATLLEQAKANVEKEVTTYKSDLDIAKKSVIANKIQKIGSQIV